jgi:hypothetical protein
MSRDGGAGSDRERISGESKPARGERVVTARELPDERRASTPRLALQRREAAEALGIGVDTFDRHVRAHLPVVYVGSVRLYPIAALERWLLSNAKGKIEALKQMGRHRANGPPPALGG